ncbi:hypothetical protein QYF36_004700 [Acer negundo]|nr:hypothetical protein QYF36_004700 [Acer negundo]
MRRIAQMNCALRVNVNYDLVAIVKFHGVSSLTITGCSIVAVRAVSTEPRGGLAQDFSRRLLGQVLLVPAGSNTALGKARVDGPDFSEWNICCSCFHRFHNQKLKPTYHFKITFSTTKVRQKLKTTYEPVTSFQAELPYILQQKNEEHHLQQK